MAAGGKTRYGRTIYLPPKDGAPAVPLRRRRLTVEPTGAAYDEDWLQQLLFQSPEVLPIGEIDESFAPAIPLCRELPTDAGPIDLAYVSESGRLTLVECKLWRNPEARREVVAQILDYAKEITGWSYERLDEVVRRARRSGPKSAGLFELTRRQNEMLDEAEFVDDVTRNLADGRFLLLVVGDGIREGVEHITEHLRRFAGIQFTFGLVELAMFEMPAEATPGGLIVEPRVLARTIEIERAIVRRADASVTVEEPPARSTQGRAGRPLSEDEFYKGIRKVNATLPDRLRSFFRSVEDMGLVVVSLTKSMVLRWDREDGTTVFFGVLYVDGRLDTHSIVQRAEQLGSEEVGVAYLRSLASLIPHCQVTPTGGAHKWRLVAGGRLPQFTAPLERADEWLEAIQQTMDALNRLAAD